MLKVKISNFIKNNIGKIKDLGTKLLIVAIVVFIATIILSANRENTNSEENNTKETYKPMQTVIKGPDVSKKKYKTDSNIVNNFLEFCNSGKLEEAYALISKECKEEMYPTIDHFKEHYYNIIFNKTREYNLQAWISTSKYTVYKIRYTNSLLSTGKYEAEDVYEDYITLNKNSDLKQISIGNFVTSKSCNIITSTNDIEATFIKKITYINEEEYEIKIKNNSDKTILLDTLKDVNGIKLLGNDVEYNLYKDKLSLGNLILNSGETQIITLRFKKSLSSNNTSAKRRFLRVIKDYKTYIEDKVSYKDIVKFDIKVEE